MARSLGGSSRGFCRVFMDVVFPERSATGEVALLKSMRVSGERTRMLTAGSRPITVESRVEETITRHPSTFPIFVQGDLSTYSLGAALRDRSLADARE